MKLFWLFVYVCSLMVLFYVTYRKTKINKSEYEERKEAVGYIDIDQLDCVNEIKEDIKTMTEMIADVRSCDPGNLVRTVQVIIPEYGHRYEFLVDGHNEISDILVDLFHSERENLSTSLRSEIQKIK